MRQGEDRFRGSLAGLGISFSATSPESAQLAGSILTRYRREGGPREHLIADFPIGLQAQVQADRMAAMDGGDPRRYCARLRVLKP